MWQNISQSDKRNNKKYIITCVSKSFAIFKVDQQIRRR